MINKSIDEFLGDVFMNKNANLYKEIASIALALWNLKDFALKWKTCKNKLKSAKRSIAFRILRREANKQRRTRENRREFLKNPLLP